MASMSKDIRSYFFKNKESSNVDRKESENQAPKKRSRRILDSDEEDNVILGESQKKKHKELDRASTQKTQKKSEVVVQVENFFGNTPVLQKKQKIVSPTKSKHIQKESVVQEKKVKPKSNKGKRAKSTCDTENPTFECDDELEASILETDDEVLIHGVSSAKRSKQDTLKTPIKSVNDEKISNQTTEKKENIVEKNKTPNSSQKKKNSEAYQKYLHRSGPKNPGSKEIPEGSPTCLQGYVFVITGILDSLEREEAVDLIQKCGGRVTSQVSKKTNFVVVGEEPGESKIQKAEKFGTKTINEDELIKLIIERSDKDSRKNDNFIEGTPEKTPDCFGSSKKQRNENTKSTHDSSRPFPKVDQKAVRSHHELFTSVKPPSKIDNTEAEMLHLKEDISQDELWVDKYKPKSTKNIVGQAGDKSNVKKLTYWLQNWHKNHSGKKEKKTSRPAPWAQNDDGSFFKAALLSGPPGVGKTTTVNLVCQELGLDVIEFNASDTRSKRLLQEDVSELLSSRSLKGFLQEKGKPYSNQVLVMDEVDGMAGNEDRGGIQELIQLVKQTKIPIIGICNDRNHQKIRSLVNYCFDLRFQRPPVKQIKAAMMSICFKENINISGDALEELIVSSNHDLRQVLHKLSLLTFADKSLSFEDAKKNGLDGKKPLNLGPWDVVRKVFSSSDQQNLSINDRIDLFFQDYSLGPLFVQDTYLHVKPHKAKNSLTETMSLISEAADGIALGDVVERVIRNHNSWNLLPVQAVFSTLIPGQSMSGHFTGRIEFPVWLGKNSRGRKIARIIQELHTSLSARISGDGSALNLDYVQHLRDCISRPLLQRGAEGVPESVKFMVDYGLVREDVDHVLELASWPGFGDPFSRVDSKVKAAFTRALNKECQRVSCVSKKSGNHSGEQAGEEDGEEEALEEDENDGVDVDPMIKKGKPKKSTKTESGNAGREEKKEGTAKKERKKKDKKKNE